MHSEQERQAQARRAEDKIRQIDEEIRFLNWQIANIEKMIHRALERVEMVDWSIP
jgi:hypothetical protein